MHTDTDTDIRSFLLAGLPAESSAAVVDFLISRVGRSAEPARSSVAVAPVSAPAASDGSDAVLAPPPAPAGLPAVGPAMSGPKRIAPVEEWRSELLARGIAPAPAPTRGKPAPKARSEKRLVPASAPQGWAAVVEHMPQLERIAGRMARVDERLDAGDLLQELVADLVASAALFDAARGPWLTWAKTRCWLARTRALRVLNRQAPRYRVSLSAEGEDSAEAGVVRGIAVGLGEWGTASRCEAIADLQQLYDRATPEGKRELLARVRGESTGRGGDDRLDEATRGAAMGMNLRG